VLVVFINCGFRNPVLYARPVTVDNHVRRY
jgi:hypothetical protein